MTDAKAYFTGLAEDYDAYRPRYASAAIAAIRPDGRLALVGDVGCGTGISTRQLAGLGAPVVGIDPNEDMLAAARRLTSETLVTYRAGTGEDTTFERGSVDLLVCAQSFHWFDAERAVAEFHRVLRPGGRLALLWNVRDKTAPASAVYESLVKQAQSGARARGRVVPAAREYLLEDPARFSPVRRLTFDNPQLLDEDGLLGRLRSASYFPHAPGPDRSAIESGLRALFRDHAIDGVVTLAQRTEVTLSDRRAGS